MTSVRKLWATWRAERTEWNRLTWGIRLVKNLNSCLPASKGLSSVTGLFSLHVIPGSRAGVGGWKQKEGRLLAHRYNFIITPQSVQQIFFSWWENKISIGGLSQGWLQHVRESTLHISASGWSLRCLPILGFYDFIRNLSLLSRLLYVQMFVSTFLITCISIETLQ